MKFFDLLQEAIYDIVGYIIPGLIAIPFLILFYYNDFKYTSLYYLYIDINNIKSFKIFFSYSVSHYIFIIIISYIIGILLKYASIIINKITNKVFKPNSKIRLMFKKLKGILLYEQSTSIDYIKEYIIPNTGNLTNKYNIQITSFNTRGFIEQFSRSTSRFNGHKNLTQKYIAKTNLFSSLSGLFAIEFINSILSLLIYSYYSIIYFYKNHLHIVNLSKIFIPIFITFLMIFLFLCCYVEYKAHKKYQNNENFFYLMETFYKN